MFEAIIFDFDGTLVDSNDIKKGMFFKTVENIPHGPETMSIALERVTGPREAVFQTFVSLSREDGLDVNKFLFEYSRLTHDAVCSCPEMDGAQELLESLKSLSSKVIISSATPLVYLEPIIAAKGWDQYFSDIFGAPLNKPQILEKYVLPFVSDVTNIAIIGDGEDDLFSASNIGAQFFPVGEARGTNKTDHIYSLRELKELFTRPHHH